MSEAAGPPFEPLFLDGPAGRIFAIYHPPRPEGAAPAAIYIPPFAEELNRSRRVAALLARRLAGAGFGALLLDPFGCGDSEGEFRDARWEIWRGDVLAASAFLRSRGHDRVSLIGLRLGALLALDAAQALSCDRVVLWQPVVRGDQMMTQFLRLRRAGALSSGKDGGESTAQLRGRLRAGEMLEIAGYELAPDLALAIDGLRLKELGLACAAPVDWVAVEPEDAPASPVQEEIIAAWRAGGRSARACRAAAEPFWNLQETTLAPALIETTATLLTARAA